MHVMSFKKHLYIFVFALACLMFSMPQSMAEDVPPPVPVAPVEAQSLLPPPGTKTPVIKKKSAPKKTKPLTNGRSLFALRQQDGKIENGYVVLELFTTQACTFCPKADALFQDYIDHDDVIALGCHVDYFDVKEGSLSVPICSSRQYEYEKSLNAGSKYTPQAVFNGQINAVGYLQSDMQDALDNARNSAVARIEVQQLRDGLFQIVLPPMAKTDTDRNLYKIWMLPYDLPHTVRVADGANQGKDITYYNRVSGARLLGQWDGKVKVLQVPLTFDETVKGYAILVQDEQQKIVAAAKILK